MDTSNTNSNPGLEKPPGTPTATPPGGAPSETVIHVIPDEFYGAALKKRVVEPPKKPAIPVSPTAPKPPVPTAPKPPQPKRRGPLPIIIVVVLLLVVLGGGAAYYFLIYKPGQTVKKPVQQPAVNTNVNAPSEPICGDGKCAASENFASCPVDCPPPGPVCGDNKCEDPETLETCAADCQPAEPVAGLDSDSDGVTDAEETGIYGTDQNNSDSDGDSFVDLNEVLNLFNPAKSRPSMLADNPGVAVYKNTVLGYEIFRPAAWVVSEKGENNMETYFTSSKGEFIEVLTESNDAGKTLMDWYLEQSPGVKSSEVQLFKTLAGYEEILSPDKMTAFVAAGKKVFVISYNLGDSDKVDYKITFKMMVNSLKVAQ